MSDISPETFNVHIRDWPQRAMPVSEIQAALAFVAHKTARPVHVSPYNAVPQYSDKVVHVYFCSTEGNLPSLDIP
ncbi:MAG: hypothetical protein FJ278_19665, partial [Planctomycetes bacterium]|nr:hypothetical protein [Planctomycetota bacterium]